MDNKEKSVFCLKSISLLIIAGTRNPVRLKKLKHILMIHFFWNKFQDCLFPNLWSWRAELGTPWSSCYFKFVLSSYLSVNKLTSSTSSAHFRERGPCLASVHLGENSPLASEGLSEVLSLTPVCCFWEKHCPTAINARCYFYGGSQRVTKWNLR